MHLKSLLLLILGTSTFFVNAKEVCTLIINTQKADTNNSYYIMSQSIFIYEGNGYQQLTDTTEIEIEEPLPCFYIVNNDTSKVFIFWIEPGIVELNINNDRVRNSIAISVLNNEYQIQNRKSDSIFSLLNYNNKALCNQNDSLSSIYNKHMKELYKEWYKEAFKKTSSFLTLSNIHFHLGEFLVKQKKATFTKKELYKLFKRLNKHMENYPTYKKCDLMFKHKVRKRPEINKPLSLAG